MAWTYTDTLTTDRDKIRSLIGDIDTNDQQLTDEFIAAKVTSEGSVNGAAVACCRALIAKYSRKVSSSVGKLSKQSSDLVKHYRELLSEMQQLRSYSSIGAATFVDTDREPAFTRDMMESDAESPNNDE